MGLENPDSDFESLEELLKPEALDAIRRELESHWRQTRKTTALDRRHDVSDNLGVFLQQPVMISVSSAALCAAPPRQRLPVCMDARLPRGQSRRN
jgi:hypothetical protein